MKLFSSLLGAVALAALASTNVWAAAATATPATAVTPSAVGINKNVGSSAAWLKRVFAGQCTIDPINLAIDDSQVLNCTIVGTVTTDAAFVQMGVTGDPGATSWCADVKGAWVSAADTVSFRLHNDSTAACNLGSTAFNVLVLRPNSNY